MLTAENFRFARQAGATHIVAHWVDYFHDSPKIPATDSDRCWGISDNRGKLWSEEELRGLKREVNEAGLELHAIENFDPSHWHDILLDGPRRAEQMEDVKTLIRTLGRVGIPVMGYNFSIAGVWGHVVGPWARGGAESVGFLGPLRNVKGKVPRYHEVFLDEGDVDIVRALRIYRRNGYGGVVIPDHTPRMTCDAPWHAGMAWALGYIRGILNSV